MFLKSAHFVISLLICLHFAGRGGGSPTSSRDFFDNSEDIKTVAVDINGPINEALLKEFNITQQDIVNAQRNLADSKSQKPPIEKAPYNKTAARILEIKDKVKAVYFGNPNEDADQTIHEMATYPRCTNYTRWRQEQILDIRFDAEALKKPNLDIDKGFLRLYKSKLLPGSKTQDTQLRVTVSAFLSYNKAKRNKTTTIDVRMIDGNHKGWVELNIIRAIRSWHNNAGRSEKIGSLQVELHDDNGNALKPGEYFEPHSCTNQGPAIPWSFYQSGFPAFYINSLEVKNIPDYPRIDMQLHDRPMQQRPRPIYRRPFHFSTSQEPTTMPAPTDNFLEYGSSGATSAEIVRRHKKRHSHSHHHHASTSTTPATDREALADPTETVKCTTNC